GTLGWPEHENHIDGWDVDALIEQIDRKDDVDSSCSEVGEGGTSLFLWRIGPYGDGGKAVLIEDPGHVSRMIHADAETECSRLANVADIPPELIDYGPRPEVICSNEVG